MFPSSNTHQRSSSNVVSQQVQQVQSTPSRNLAFDNPAFEPAFETEEKKEYLFSKFLIEFEKLNPGKRGMLDLLLTESQVSEQAIQKIFEGRCFRVTDFYDVRDFHDMKELLKNMCAFSYVFYEEESTGNETTYGTETSILKLIEKLKQETCLSMIIKNLAIKKYGITFFPTCFFRSSLVIADEVNYMKEQKQILAKVFKVLVNDAIKVRLMDEERTNITQNVCQALEIDIEPNIMGRKKMNFAFQIVFKINECSKEMVLGFEITKAKEADALVEDVIRVSSKALQALEMAYGQKVKIAKAYLLDIFVPIKLIPTIALNVEEAFNKLLASCIGDDQTSLKITDVNQFKSLLSEKEIKDELNDFNTKNKFNDKILNFIAQRADEFISKLDKEELMLTHVKDEDFVALFLKPSAKKFLKENFYDIMLAFPELKKEKFQILNLALAKAFATHVIEDIMVKVKHLKGEKKLKYSERQIEAFCELCIKEEVLVPA